MKKEIAEYEVGKRHLANIMGVDPKDFSQADIDVSVPRSYNLNGLLVFSKVKPL